MRNVKKARPAVGAAGQAAGLCDRAGQQSHEQYSTERTGKASCIYDLLPVGSENAISRRQLMQMTGLADRQLRRRIEKERRIVTGNDHVFSSHFANLPKMLQVSIQ